MMKNLKPLIENKDLLKRTVNLPSDLANDLIVDVASYWKKVLRVCESEKIRREQAESVPS